MIDVDKIFQYSVSREENPKVADPCPNWAARWLFCAGIILILAYGNNLI